MTDTERLEWMMPIMQLAEPEGVADYRTMLLFGAITLGKQGREAIDAAMESDKTRVKP